MTFFCSLLQYSIYIDLVYSLISVSPPQKKHIGQALLFWTRTYPSNPSLYIHESKLQMCHRQVSSARSLYTNALCASLSKRSLMIPGALSSHTSIIYTCEVKPFLQPSLNSLIQGFPDSSVHLELKYVLEVSLRFQYFCHLKTHLYVLCCWSHDIQVN